MFIEKHSIATKTKNSGKRHDYAAWSKERRVARAEMQPASHGCFWLALWALMPNASLRRSSTIDVVTVERSRCRLAFVQKM